MSESPVSTLEEKTDRHGLLALIGAGGAAAVTVLLARSNGAEVHGTLHRDSSTGDPAIHGYNTSNGPGVLASGIKGPGVHGLSTWSTSVYGCTAGLSAGT